MPSGYYKKETRKSFKKRLAKEKKINARRKKQNVLI